MVSLDPELSKLFLVLMTTRHPSSSQNGSTFANCLKQKLETSFLQHESKIEDSLRFFPDNGIHKKKREAIVVVEVVVEEGAV